MIHTVHPYLHILIFGDEKSWIFEKFCRLRWLLNNWFWGLEQLAPLNPWQNAFKLHDLSSICILGHVGHDKQYWLHRRWSKMCFWANYIEIFCTKNSYPFSSHTHKYTQRGRGEDMGGRFTHQKLVCGGSQDKSLLQWSKPFILISIPKSCKCVKESHN